MRTCARAAPGCIIATTNANSAKFVQPHETWRNADADADEQQQALDATRAAFAHFPTIPAMKAAVAWKPGRQNGVHVRPLLVDLNAEQRQKL